MEKPDLYIDMECGIKIPIIQVQDEQGCPLNIAPVESLKLLENGSGKIFVKEAEEIDNNIFFYADKLERSEQLLIEIKNSTDIIVKF